MPGRLLVLLLTVAALLRPASVDAQRTRTFGSFTATTSVAFSTTTLASGRNAAIAWRCMTDGLNVIYLMAGEPVGAEMDREVTVHTVAGDHAQSQRWMLLEGHRAAFLPRASVEAFTLEALDSKTLSLRATDPVSGQTFVDEFALDGLRAALQYILPCEF